MADLPTNYMDDILAESMNGKRKYRVTRADGSFEEVTLEDISEYEQIGSVFGAGDINRINQAVNEKFDSGDVVDPMETTIPGFAADALAVKNQFNEQNKNLQWFIDNGYLPDPNNPNIVLYDYGKINENMVADFSATGTGSVRTFTKEANYLYSEAGNASGVLLYTVKPINLNNVKKVHFVMINSSTTNMICLNTTMPSSWVDLSKEQPIAVTSSPTDLVMDVTDYNGEYYLCVKTKSLSNTKIYKIYLEY